MTELRPLSLGQLLDRTFSNYREHFWLFVGIMAPPQVLVVISSVLFQSFQHANFSTSTPQNPAQTVAQLRGVLGAALGGFVAAGLVHLVVYTVALGATACALSEVYLGRTISIRESYHRVKGKIGRLIGLMLCLILILIAAYLAVVVGAIVVAGLLAAVVRALGAQGALVGVVIGALTLVLVFGGMLLAFAWVLRYSVSVPALVLENARIGQALRRSSFLTQGRLWGIFLTAVLMWLISAVAAVTFQGPFWAAGAIAGFKFGVVPAWLSVPMAVSGAVGGALSGPFLMIALALIYYDARVRKEAFDLQLMMQNLDPSAPGTTPEPPPQAGPRLEKTSVALVVLFVIVTLGIYAPVWFLTRREALNRLNSPEKVGTGIFIGALVLYCVYVGGSFFLLLPWISPANKAETSSLLGCLFLAAGIVLLIQAFKVKGILEDHINSQARAGLLRQSESLSGVAVFFLSIYYLQYKINRFFGLLSQPVPNAVKVAGLASEQPPIPEASQG